MGDEKLEDEEWEDPLKDFLDKNYKDEDGSMPVSAAPTEKEEVVLPSPDEIGTRMDIHDDNIADGEQDDNLSIPEEDGTLPPITDRIPQGAHQMAELRRERPQDLYIGMATVIIAGIIYYLVYFNPNLLEMIPFYFEWLGIELEYSWIGHFFAGVSVIFLLNCILQLLKPGIMKAYDTGIWFQEDRFFVPYERMLEIHIRQSDADDPHTRHLEFVFAGSPEDAARFKNVEYKESHLPDLVYIYYNPHLQGDDGLNYKFTDLLPELNQLYRPKAAALQSMLNLQ